MEDQQPVTKAELAQGLESLKTDLTASLTAVIRDVETKLLGAFFAYQEHEWIQFQHLKADTGNATRAAELRLDNIEQRLQQVERKVLGGPQG